MEKNEKLSINNYILIIFIVILISIITFLPIKIEKNIRVGFCDYLVEKGYFKVEDDSKNITEYDLCIDEYVGFMRGISE